MNETNPVSQPEESPPGFHFDEQDDRPKTSGGKVRRIGGRRGRKPSKIDQKAKLERSRQSARECRARKKQKYLYLEETVANKERAICALREELDMYKQWCRDVDKGIVPPEIKEALKDAKQTADTSSDLNQSKDIMDRETQD
ncbi:cAMP-responsive element-binding protein-like 2 [Amphiura filiformis]|uniref:cAMP-responsive element-binding protein-like 2 n=1 Tax=Amphiura filiformis TaxID=82378 RepID=UPI003B21332F